MKLSLFFNLKANTVDTVVAAANESTDNNETLTNLQTVETIDKPTATKKFVTAKKTTNKPSKEKATSKQITMMLILVSLLYSTCNLPFACIMSARVLKLDNKLPSAFFTFAYSWLVLLVSAKIIIYICFNKLFRQVLIGYLIDTGNKLKLAKIKSKYIKN